MKNISLAIELHKRTLEAFSSKLLNDIDLASKILLKNLLWPIWEVGGLGGNGLFLMWEYF